MKRTSKQVREEFIQFFVDRGHTFVPSSSLLPGDDPTLLFTNAGMNQFKDVFLGAGSRPYSRAANSQKCIRAGGKHNDLEDVGHDTYHQTFFEMLGNWSFGDYFKPEAIEWAWELLTGVWGLPKDKLWATVFGGEEASGLSPDEEAENLWPKVTDLPAGRVLRGKRKDNFWEPAETGPCGPCTEIHIDLGAGLCDGSRHPGTKCGVNVEGCGRFIELWNLVFIQFNRTEGNVLAPLPARHVDTGMGFERVTAVLQGKTSNYDSDVFAPLLGWIASRSGLAYGADVEVDVAFRVVADHARACSFAIADGILPSNEGRGYVIRRILRRAARFGRKLGRHEPFLHEMVPVIAEQMGEAFPEVAQRRDQVAETIRQEEESFNRTLDRGIELFERAAGKADKQLSGEVAFELYATYGFPADLTQVMAGERGLTVDMEGYEAEMERHREISGVRKELLTADMWKQNTRFVGYKEQKIPTHVVQTLRIERDKDGSRHVTGAKLKEGDEGIVVLEETPFYAEKGGQVGDTGYIRQDSGVFRVTDTQIETLGPGIENYCHFGYVESGEIVEHRGNVRRTKPGSESEAPPPGTPGSAEAIVDEDSRTDIKRNHTATHLLNWALRQVLGDHVQQAGSVVEPRRLRFDFAHGQAVSAEQLAEVERLVNELILADEPVFVNEMPLAEAQKIPGVRAVFGEKYGQTVRVISVGVKDPLRQADGKTPVEFCGGTHLERTGQAGLFKILSEESVAKGVRRITAVTGHEAVAWVQRMDEAVRSASAALRVPVEGIAERIAAMQKEIKQLRKARSSGAGMGGLDSAASAGEDVGGVKVIVTELDADSPEALRSAVDQLRQKAGGPAAVMVGARGDGTVTLVAGLSEEVFKAHKVKAGDWVKAAAAVVGGSGGGKPTMAQAGGKDAEKLPEALAAAREWMRQQLAK